MVQIREKRSEEQREETVRMGLGVRRDVRPVLLCWILIMD
jgi:hypothetical protein